MSRNSGLARISTCLVIFECVAFIAAVSKPGIWYDVEPISEDPPVGGPVHPEWGEGRFFFRPTTNTAYYKGSDSRLEIADANAVKLQETLDGQLLSLNKILKEVDNIEKEISHYKKGDKVDDYHPKQPPVWIYTQPSHKGDYGESYSHNKPKGHYEFSESYGVYQPKPQPVVTYEKPPHKGDYSKPYSHHQSNNHYENSEPDDHYHSKSSLVWICKQASYKGDYEKPYSHHKPNDHYGKSEPDDHYQPKPTPIWICKQTSYKGESNGYYGNPQPEYYSPPKGYGRYGRFLPNSQRGKQLKVENKLSKPITKSSETIKEKSSDKSSKTLKLEKT